MRAWRRPGAAWPIRFAFGIALLVIVLIYYDVEAALRALGSTRWWLAGPGVVGLALVHILAAGSWRSATLSLADVSLPWMRALRVYYIAQALGALTPGNIGSDAYRAKAVAGCGASWKQALLAGGVYRAASYLSLAALASVAAWFVPVPVVARLAIASIPVAVLVLGLLWFVRRIWVAGTSGGRRATVWRAIKGPVLFAAAFHLLAIGATVLLVIAVSEDVELVGVAGALLVARVVAMLPLTPSGLGVQEGAFALLLPEAGLTPEAAVAVSALTRVALLATLCIGSLATLTSDEAESATSVPLQSSELARRP